MKKIMITLASVFVASLCMAEGWQVSVGTNSTIIAPATGNPFQNADGSYSNMYTSTEWAAGALSQGSYVKSGKVTYWLASGGTATNAPTHVHGVAEVDGITYVAINKHTKRSSLVISLDNTTETVVINDNEDATATGGLVLSSALPGIEYGRFDGYVTAISTNGVIKVNIKSHQE